MAYAAEQRARLTALKQDIEAGREEQRRQQAGQPSQVQQIQQQIQQLQQQLQAAQAGGPGMAGQGGGMGGGAGRRHRGQHPRREHGVGHSRREARRRRCCRRARSGRTGPARSAPAGPRAICSATTTTSPSRASRRAASRAPTPSCSGWSTRMPKRARTTSEEDHRSVGHHLPRGSVDHREQPPGHRVRVLRLGQVRGLGNRTVALRQVVHAGGSGVRRPTDEQQRRLDSRGAPRARQFVSQLSAERKGLEHETSDAFGRRRSYLRRVAGGSANPHRQYHRCRS